MAKKKVTKKVSLKELLGTGGKANADLHQNNEKKRKYHLKYRTPRNRLITSNGMGYDRALSGDIERDMKYHELAREFVNNGFDKARAYAAVNGTKLTTGYSLAVQNIFNSSWMRAKIREITLGTDGEPLEELPKEYFLQQLHQMIESNILDYMDDDGRGLNVAELRALPTWAQKLIKRLQVDTTTIPVAVKDENGEVVRDENGEATYVEVSNQRVIIELYDRIKALELLGKAMRWITTDTNVNVNFLTPELLMKANTRVKQLGREDIEGKAKRVASD